MTVTPTSFHASDLFMLDQLPNGPFANLSKPNAGGSSKQPQLKKAPMASLSGKSAAVGKRETGVISQATARNILELKSQQLSK